MAIQAAAGAALLVTTAHPATFDEAGYGALIAGATEVGEVTNIGEFGKEVAAILPPIPLAQKGQRKLKGSYNNGTLNPSINLDTEDAGQIIMEQLLESDDPGTFFVVMADGTTYCMEALVMTFRPSINEVDSVVTATCSMEVTEKAVVRIAAS